MPRLPLALLMPLVLLAAAPAVAQGLMKAPPPPLHAGTRAPAFATTTLAGQPLSLRSLRGRIVMLDFWATWCGPCRMATPTLKSLHRRFHRRGFTVVGMSVDDKDTLAQVKPFVQAFHLQYPVTASPAANGRAQTLYHADMLPAEYLIDGRGIVRWSQFGYAPGDRAEIARIIRRLLAERRHSTRTRRPAR